MSAQVIVEMSGDEAKLVNSLLKVIQQNNKVKDSLRGVGDESKKTNDSLIGTAREIGQSWDQSIQVLQKVGGALNAVMEIDAKRLEINREALDIATKLAKGQSEGAKNMAGSSPAESQRLFDSKVYDIAGKVGFSDLGLVSEALGATTAIVGNEKAPETVEVAAELTALNQSQLPKVSSAIADIVKNSGLSVKESTALAGSAIGQARPEDMGNLMQGLATVIKQAITTASPEANQTEVIKAATARYALMSAVDPGGQSTATAQLGMDQLLFETFNPTQEDRQKRGDRIEELLRRKEITSEEQTEIDGAKMQAGYWGKMASALPANDSSPGALNVRQKFREAEAKLSRAQRSATLDPEEAKELSRLTELKRLSETKDPGTYDSRLAMVAESQPLNQFVEKRMTGEAKFLPGLRASLQKDSPESKAYAETLKNVSTDQKYFDDLIESQQVTPQQQMARRTEKSRAFANVRLAKDTKSAELAAIDEIVKESFDKVAPTGFAAIQNQIGKWAGRVLQVDPDSFLPSSFTNDPEQAYRNAIKTVRSQRVDSLPTLDEKKMSDSDRIVNEFLNNQIKLLEAGLENYIQRIQNAAGQANGNNQQAIGAAQENAIVKELKESNRILKERLDTGRGASDNNSRIQNQHNAEPRTIKGT